MRLHTTLEDLWPHYTTLEVVSGWPLDTFFWALTIAWSRLLARVWSGPKHNKVQTTERSIITLEEVDFCWDLLYMAATNPKPALIVWYIISYCCTRDCPLYPFRPISINAMAEAGGQPPLSLGKKIKQYKAYVKYSKEEVGGSNPGCEISSLRDGKLAGWSTASCVLALACWSCVSKKEIRRSLC